MYRLLRFFYKNQSALTSLLLLPPQSRRLCGDPQYTLHVACGIHFCKSCRRAHSAASPLSQKVTLGVPVRLQAPSRRLAVATNFLRVTGVQLQPLKSQKNLFHVNETRRSKLCIACSDFLQKSERAHVAAPPSPAKPAAMRGPPIYAACRLRHTFLQKLPARSFRCVSSFAKSHARRACSVASALTTARCRYQLFASYGSSTPTSEKPKKSFSCE